MAAAPSCGYLPGLLVFTCISLPRQTLPSPIQPLHAAATSVVTSTAMALMSKLVLASAVASTAAFAPSSSARASTALAARQPIIAGNW